MKEIIAQALSQEPQASHKRLVLAEFLQHLILQSIYRNGFFGNMTFTGGTALRILYRIGRFSEDLDFSLTQAQGFVFRRVLEMIQRDLRLQQFEVELHLREQKNVASADMRFPGLLQEFKLSALRDQKLTIKLEVDTNPPKGGELEMALVADPLSYTVSVFDRPSLFATKLHAILYRGYVKGRDYYDLMWYLSKAVRPNLKLLNRAICQTEGPGHSIHEQEFKQKLRKKLESVDFKEIRKEMERFIMDRRELKFLEPALIINLLERNY